jgi:superfamily I DNA/RNA helicase
LALSPECSYHGRHTWERTRKSRSAQLYPNRQVNLECALALIRRAIRARYPILAIDEYQDLGAPLHEIVVALIECGTRVLAVGDPNQSIYGFTGAQPELLESLSRRRDVEVARLRFNYRCGKRIVATSNVTIPRPHGEVSKSEHEGLIDWHECPEGIQQQAEFICSTLLGEIIARNPGVTIGDIAVLYPAKYDGDEIASAARRAGISFTRADKNAAYPRTPLTRWLELCASWCSDGWILGDPALSSLIRTWVRFNRSVTSLLAVRKIKTALVQVLVRSRDPNLPLLPWLCKIEEEVLRSAFESEPALRDEAEAFATLKQAASPSGPLGGGNLERFGAERGAPHYLNLITLHSSKGREFEAVIVMGLDLGKLPRNEYQNEEERRLFYVGLTRAKREFHMTFSGWIATRRGRWVRGVSPFLLEIQQQALDNAS